MRRVPIEPMSRLAPLSRWLGLFAAGLTLLAIGGVRLGGVPPMNGVVLFAIAIAGAALAIVAGGGAMIQIWRHGGAGLSLAVKGSLFALAALGPAAWFGVLATQLPMINDVTTDVGDPPSFGRSRASVDARGGLIVKEFDPATTADHREAYADLQPIILEQAPEDALALALRAATNLGWTVIDSTPPAGRTGAGRVEATARSLLFGFTDDITIRIRPAVNETRIDVRSSSRVGRHDFGVNARRIQAFQREIEALAAQR